MSNTPDTPASMKGTWPLPQDRLSWLMAGLLFVGLIFAYYHWFYPRLEAANTTAYTFTEQRSTSKDSKPQVPVKLEVALPVFISNLTEQTLFLSVTNVKTEDPETNNVTVKVVPSIVVECDGDENTPPCVEEDDYYVFLSVPDDSQPTLAKGGYLLFPAIAPGASVSQELTVEVVGLAQAVTSGEAHDDISDANMPKPKPKVTVSFDIIEVIDEDTDAEPIPFSPVELTKMEIDAARAAVQGVMSFLLLPPWANGFIPFLAIFIVYLFAIPEALRHCFPKTSAERTRRKKLVALLKFLTWLLIMAGIAVLVLWTLTQLAVVVLAGEDWATMLLPGGSLLLLALVAWVIDWFIIQPPAGHSGDKVTMTVNADSINIQPPDGQPMTMAVNAAALTIGPPAGQPMTMTVNPATLNIQPPDGQPMTMAVNAVALTLELTGDHPGHGCHPPAALPGETPPPAAESAPVPVEPPRPAPPKRTRRRRQPASAAAAEQAAPAAAAEQAAPAAAAEQAAPAAAAEQAAPAAAAEQAAQAAAAEQAAQAAPPPASPLPDAAPSPQEWRALMAQVSELQAQLTSLRVSSAPPASEPLASDAAQPEAQVAPSPESDVPEQPAGLSPQEGDIFSPPPALPLMPPTTAPEPDVAPQPPAPDAAADDRPLPDRDPF